MYLVKCRTDNMTLLWQDSRNLLGDISVHVHCSVHHALGKKGQKTWSPSFTRSIMLSAGSRPSNDGRQTESRYGWIPQPLSLSLLLSLMGSNWTNIHHGSRERSNGFIGGLRKFMLSSQTNSAVQLQPFRDGIWEVKYPIIAESYLKSDTFTNGKCLRTRV